MRPQAGVADAVGEADQPADDVVALVVGQPDDPHHDLGEQVRRVQSPPGAEVRRELPDGWGERLDLGIRDARYPRVQRDGVGHDGRHVGKQAGGRRHGKAGRPLTVHDGFHRVGPGLGHDGADQGRVVVDRCLVERPLGGREVDAGAPVLEPHVPPVVDQHVDQRRLSRRPEDVGSHAGTVHQHDRAAGRRPLTGHVVEVEHRAIVSGHRNDVGVCRCHGSSSRGYLSRPRYVRHKAVMNIPPNRVMPPAVPRNVVSWRAKSRVRITRIPRARMSSGSSGTGRPS